MQIRISPDIVALLETDPEVEQQEILQKLWRDAAKEVEAQKEQSLAKQNSARRVPKRARFSFD
jgi:adenylate kinase